MNRLTRSLAIALLALVFGDAAQCADAPSADTKPAFWLVPHTHWEGAVFKTREEYLEMGLPNILTAVRLLKEHPNYRFALDQVAYFRPFLERYPEAAADFRKFVAEGRLQIVCGLDIMPDDNMPSGESFVRQMLYSKTYVRDQLGVDVKVGWLIDTFGHHAQMPQILRLGGYHSFWFSRGVEDRRTMPSEFLWQGIDGSRIPAFWLPHFYGHLYGPPRDLPHFTEFMKSRFDALATFSRIPDRVGLAGVDVSEPELYVPDLVEAFNRQTNMPFTLKIGVPTDFEASAAKRSDLPVVTGERNPLFQGIYSSRIELKHRMREAERLLTTAEKFGAMERWLGFPSDDSLTWRAWEPALFNVTHDLASGVMTDGVYADTVSSYNFSERLAKEMIESRLRNILARANTEGEGAALAVFNTLGWPRTDIAEGDVGFAQGGVKDFDLVDAAGKVVPSQLFDSEHFDDGGLKRIKFAFVASNVPALGYAIYHVVPRQSGTNSKSASDDAGASGVLENELYKVSVDPKTGAVASLETKADGWQALKGPANVVAVETDNGDFWELYKNLDGAQNLIMTRPLPVPGRGQARFSNDDPGKDAVVRSGPVFSEIEVSHPLGTNSFATQVRVYKGVARIDFTTRIVNRERFVRYRMLVPSSIQNGRNFQEIPFGAIERPMAQEFPAQNWIDYGDNRHGVALLNRGNPGNNIADGTLMLSLLRSTRIQSYGIGGGFEGQGSESGLELGKELIFHYALVPHAGDWREAGVARAGLEFNNPLIVRKAEPHGGAMPSEWGWLSVSAPNVVLTAVKPARDGDTVVRVYEAAGKATTGAKLKLNAKIEKATEANLMEDPGARLRVRDSSIEFDLHPFEIKTFKFKLASRRPPE